MELLSFKGYQGSVETSIADDVLHGKLLFVGDLVTYEAQTLADLRKEFEAAVTDYIETCKAIGKKPEKPLSGQFNVRPGQERHQRAIVRALKDGTSLNAVVCSALDSYLSDSSAVHNHVHTHEHVVKVSIDRQESAWSTPSQTMQFIEVTSASDGNQIKH